MNNARTNEDIKIEEHLKLVHSCCQRFRGRGIEYDDIFQSGCIGLTKAKNNFDFNFWFVTIIYILVCIVIGARLYLIETGRDN